MSQDGIPQDVPSKVEELEDFISELEDTRSCNIPSDLSQLFTENHPVLRHLTDKEKRKKKAIFLQKFLETHRHDLACKAAGVPLQTDMIWANQDPDFEAALAQAKVCSIKVLEDSASRRAVKGTLKPVYQQGRLAGYVRQYSDSMLAILLSAADPEKYRKRISHGGDDSVPPIRTKDLGLSREAANQIRAMFLGLDEK
jgi:hypothetical protein